MNARLLVYFDTMPSPEVLGELAGLHETLRADYPTLQRKPAGQWSGSQEPMPLEGVAFSLVGPNLDVRREVRFSRMSAGTIESALSVQSTDFKGWTATRRDVRKALGLALPVLLKGARIAQVGLVFHRRISLAGEEFNVHDLFRKGGGLLPPSMFGPGTTGSPKMLIENRTVYSEEHEGEGFTHRSSEIDVKFVPMDSHGSGEELWLEIRTAKKYSVNPGHGSPTPAKGRNLVLGLLERLRNENDELLAQVLSDTGFAAIGKEAP